MPETNAFLAVMETATAFWRSRSVHVVAELGIADAIDDVPRSAVELAELVQVDAGALNRILRQLAAIGIFEAHDQARYGHTEASRVLRSDHPTSLRGFARMLGTDLCWGSFGQLLESVRTGRPTEEKVGPGGPFKYFRDHPEDAQLFDAAMTSKAHGQVAAVLGVYDFASFRTIADVGGGRGHLIKRVLDSAPLAKGILFDLPYVIAESSALASDRLSLRAGSFFQDPLPTADAYLLMEVLHDWPDPESLTILQAIRAAAPSNATLLVIENLLPEPPGPHWANDLDINMLTMTGGLERTRTEYERLLEKAGFRLTRTLAMPMSPVSILEATAV